MLYRDIYYIHYDIIICYITYNLHFAYILHYIYYFISILQDTPRHEDKLLKTKSLVLPDTLLSSFCLL